jgi:hypothetical protein
MMDPVKLSQADKHLIYGLLLKTNRSGRQERKLLAIVRSSMDLDARIAAILRLTRARTFDEPDAGGQDGEQGTVPPPRRKTCKDNVVVVDSRAEIASLLKKSSLKRSLSFSRVSERYDAVPLISALRARLVIVNEVLESEEEYSRYFWVCRAIHRPVRVIFLGRPAFAVAAGPGFEESTRFLDKPLSFERLEEISRELLQRQGSQVQR